MEFSTSPLFLAHTEEAFRLKVLAELLHNNLALACFHIGPTGMSLTKMDDPQKTLIHVSMESGYFLDYQYNSPQEKIMVGLNLDHMHNMLKSVKKKDNLEMRIDAENPTALYLTVASKDGTRETTSQIQILDLQNFDLSVPSGYQTSITVPSTEIAKMAKDLLTVDKTVQVTAYNNKIRFFSDGGTTAREIKFGPGKMNGDPLFNEEYATEQFTKIAKVAGLGDKVQICVGEDCPLLFKSKIGSLGHVEVCIKSKAQHERQLEEEDVSIDINTFATS